MGGKKAKKKKRKKQGESQNIGLNSLAEFLLLLFNYVFCLFCLSTWEPDSRPKLTLNNKVDTTSQKSVIVGQMFWKLALSCALIFVQKTFPLVTSIQRCFLGISNCKQCFRG